MQKKPFDKIIMGEVELRLPEFNTFYFKERYDFLIQNDNLQPWRPSLRHIKTLDDVKIKTEEELSAIQKMDSAIYGIYENGKYVGEVYAKEIIYESGTVNNLGYAVCKERRGNGLAPKAVWTLENNLWLRGTRKIHLFYHPLNGASAKVAEKCGYREESALIRKLEDINKNKGKFINAVVMVKYSNMA